MTWKRGVIFLVIYAVTFFALDRINGTAFDTVGLVLQVIIIAAFALASRRVGATPTTRGYIDEQGIYREEVIDDGDQT